MTEHAIGARPVAKDVIAVITVFLKDRLKEEYCQQSAKDWISKRANEAWQIKEATHVLKFTHPDAKCDPRKLAQNIRSPGNLKAGNAFVGTHNIDVDQYLDAAPSNAAALPVYALLRLRVGKQSILDLAHNGEKALFEAFEHFSTDPKVCISAFANCRDMQPKAASHALAKQLYWSLESGGEYHLLGPLFPASLAHCVKKKIDEDRFSDEAKAAREARKGGLAHPQGFCEYINLAVQNFGGSKPQNISQLNTERKGQNYLLPSLPPNWKSPDIRPPVAVNSVFDRIFGSRPRVRDLVRILRDFLVSVEHAGTNIRIRDKRAELAALIRDEAFQFAAELQQLEPGWSQQPECLLNSAEQCWLDPERAEDDPDFASLRRKGDWPDEVCRRFGNWLNARLTTPNTPMGAIEAAHWREVLDKEMRMMRIEVADHE